MATISKISWTDATWNIAIGCSKVDSDCKFCYMYRQSLSGTRYKPDQVTQTKISGVFTFPLRYKETKSAVWHGKPLIFTSSLTDVFHPDIDSFRDEMWDIIRKCPHLIFQILTKRPERILECLPDDWGDGWDNVWIGTSVGSNSGNGRRRISDLLLVPAKIRFASVEPIHEMVDLSDCIEYQGDGFSYRTNAYTGITYIWDANGKDGIYNHGSEQGNKLDWVIIGGESGNDNGKYKYRPANIEWFNEIVKNCEKNNIPVFVKQLGTHLSKEYDLKDRHGADMNEWPFWMSHLKHRKFPHEKEIN